MIVWRSAPQLPNFTQVRSLKITSPKKNPPFWLICRIIKIKFYGKGLEGSYYHYFSKIRVIVIDCACSCYIQNKKKNINTRSSHFTCKQIFSQVPETSPVRSISRISILIYLYSSIYISTHPYSLCFVTPISVSKLPQTKILRCYPTIR